MAATTNGFADHSSYCTASPPQNPFHPVCNSLPTCSERGAERISGYSSPPVTIEYRRRLLVVYFVHSSVSSSVIKWIFIFAQSRVAAAAAATESLPFPYVCVLENHGQRTYAAEASEAVVEHISGAMNQHNRSCGKRRGAAASQPASNSFSSNGKDKSHDDGATKKLCIGFYSHSAILQTTDQWDRENRKVLVLVVDFRFHQIGPKQLYCSVVFPPLRLS